MRRDQGEQFVHLAGALFAGTEKLVPHVGQNRPDIEQPASGRRIYSSANAGRQSGDAAGPRIRVAVGLIVAKNITPAGRARKTDYEQEEDFGGGR
jgi:hypothetical protein